MRNLNPFAALLALSAGTAVYLTAETAGARVPVLLELFTSEGCSSCPSADRMLATLDQHQPVNGADLIVLSEHVDYWDRLGWKDPFSAPEFTARQRDYAFKLHQDGVYTPQLVVDGTSGFVGSDEQKTYSAIQKAMREAKIAIAISNLQRDGKQVTARIELPGSAQSPPAGKALLFVAIAENRIESRVTRGENSGRSLAHASVVRAFKQVSTISLDRPFSKDVAIAIQPGIGSGGMRLVAFLQEVRSGHIIGVAALKL